MTGQSLSRSLVDAAAEAMAAVDRWAKVDYTDMSEAAVAAVLETLAADCERQHQMFAPERLRRLAGEVKEGDDVR